jgi:hypothetical protein
MMCKCGHSEDFHSPDGCMADAENGPFLERCKCEGYRPGPSQETLLDQYRKALENFGVTFADNGFIRMIPRTAEARYRNALTEILTLRSRHAKDCHIIAREALKGASQ